MTQKMASKSSPLLMFAGGSPEKQIEILTKEAQQNNFKGEIKFIKSSGSGKIFLKYFPQKSGFQNAISGMANGMG